MKLLSLGIKKLYGCYDYDVNFNDDVTFIYGTNGCGKTTVLNITEAIITGQLFKLFNYNFESVELQYVQLSDPKDIKVISVCHEGQKLDVRFDGNHYGIHKDDLEEVSANLKGVNEIAHFFFNRYDFLLEIKRIFNYVYLPLNRSYSLQNESMDFFSYRYHNRFMFDEEINYIGDDTRDNAMIKIESLIYRNHAKISTAINKINDVFRNNILKSQIEINNAYEFQDFLKDMEKSSIPHLKKVQKAYIKTLKELKLIDKSEEENYEKFFTDFIKEFSDSLTKTEGKDAVPINLLFKFQEISKIQKTIDIAERMEQRKTSAKKPIETFLNTMNSFIGNDEDGKEICINNDGQVYFKTKYSDKQISIHHLSSGEKQLITFFANLIFNVNSRSSGIFVVDEPELSLHLSWQKIFIDKVLEINKNIQLIFATHAPEIVGRRRDKMYKLEKKYTGDNKKKWMI